MPKADLVLEGGGVKGYAAAGAVVRLFEAGYQFERAAGTSVGALAAAFVATGMSGDEFRSTMNRLELHRIPDRGPLPIPVLSEGTGLLLTSGAYRGDYVRDWLHAELARLGRTTFGDFRRSDPGDDDNLPISQRYGLVVMVTDITHGRLLRLPWDYHLFGLDPDTQNVADAVRASLSIPLFFQPCSIRHERTGETSTLVDGGVLSNFPIGSSTAPTAGRAAGRPSGSGCCPTFPLTCRTSSPCSACRPCRRCG
jgi:NTE family protein